MVLKQRPVALAQSPYPYQFETIHVQSKENVAQLFNHKKMIEENLSKMKLWQESMSELSESSAKGQIIHPHTWEAKQKELEQLGLNKDHLQLGLGRLKYKVRLSGDRLYSFFRAIYNDYNDCYISKDHYKRYLKKYNELLQSPAGLLLFSLGGLEKIKEQIAQYQPQEIPQQ